MELELSGRRYTSFCISKLTIPNEIQALASQNQLFLRKYKLLHHKTNYSLGNIRIDIIKPIILGELQAFASQNQLFLRKYKLLHHKIGRAHV